MKTMKTAKHTAKPAIEYMSTGEHKKVTELVRGDLVSDYKMFGSDVVTVTGTQYIDYNGLPYTVVSFYGVPSSCECSHAGYANYYHADDTVSMYTIKP